MARTNPQARRPNNAIQLEGVEKVGGESFNPNTWTYAIAGAGATFTVTPGAGFSDLELRFAKWRIYDGDGNSAYGALDLGARTAAVVLNTSTLDPLKVWTVQFNAEIKRSGRRTVRATWNITIDAGSVADNPTGSGTNV